MIGAVSTHGPPSSVCNSPKSSVISKLMIGAVSTHGSPSSVWRKRGEGGGGGGAGRVKPQEPIGQQKAQGVGQPKLLGFRVEGLGFKGVGFRV